MLVHFDWFILVYNVSLREQKYYNGILHNTSFICFPVLEKNCLPHDLAGFYHCLL